MVAYATIEVFAIHMLYVNVFLGLMGSGVNRLHVLVTMH
jgi:hypothetical protein